MSDKKNIERLFQEKFKDFEAFPAPEAWDNIASKLEEKKNKKRVFPFWFNAKAAGIAAALVLGFFTVNENQNLFHWKSNAVTDETLVLEDQQSKSPTRSNTINDENLSLEKGNGIVTTQEGITTQDNLQDNNSQSVSNQNNSNSLNNSISTSNSQSRINQSISKKQIAPSSIKLSNDSEIAFHAKSSNDKSEKQITSNEKNVLHDKSEQFEKQNFVKNNQIVSVSSEEKSDEKQITTPSTKLNNDSEIAFHTKSSNDKEDKQIAINKKDVLHDKTEQFEKQNSVENNQIVSVSSEEESDEKQIATSSTKLNNDSEIAFHAKLSNDKEDKQIAINKKDVLNDKAEQFEKQNSTKKNQIVIVSSEEKSNEKQIVVSENTEANSINDQSKTALIIPNIKPIDSTVIAQVPLNPLEQILKEKEAVKNSEEEKIIAKADSKWKIRPNFAPIFMNSSKGSPIDDKFVDNNKNFENDLSVGLGVDYAVSPKIAIRTGVNKFEIGYNTYDIAYHADLYGKANDDKITTITMRAEVSNMIIEDKKSTSSKEIAVQGEESGYLNQKIGYVEVPVEVSYKLLDKKFGIQFITGVSTLFLNSNEVSIVSSNLSTVLGEANNLNKVHFSTNVGLGFKYSFWKSFEANFEPTFKYQLNTFSEKQGGFKPYIIGLYTGLSYKF